MVESPEKVRTTFTLETKAVPITIEPRFVSSELWNFDNPYCNILKLQYTMINTCAHYRAMSLSAPLIDINTSVIVLKGDPYLVLINPKIVSVSDELAIATESSPAYPGLSVKVTRPLSVRVRYKDIDGTTHTEKFSGGYSRLIQHEMCHIEGRPFWHDCNFLNRNKAIKDWKAIKRKLSKLTLASQSN